MSSLLSRVLVMGLAGLASLSHAAGSPPPTSSVPVSVEKVSKHTLPSFVEGLGTVQAFNSVTIRPQVDGQLIKLAVKEGQTVHIGDLLFEIDPRPFQAALDQAVARKAQDQAQLANAKLDLQRYSSLSDRNYISRQQVDSASAQVMQLTAMVQGDEAAIEAARVTLGYTMIRSPIEGRVGIRTVDVGNIVHASDTAGLVTITQLQPIHLLFTLPEDSLQTVLHAPSEQRMTVTALSRDGSTVLGEGQLDLVDNQVDQSTGMIKLRATLPNKAGDLWPGQFVNARLTLQQLSGVLAIPLAAIQRGPQGRYVFVIKQDGSADLRPIEVGAVSDGFAVVLKGLTEGESVVTNGQYRLQSGSKVDIRPSPAAAP